MDRSIERLTEREGVYTSRDHVRASHCVPFFPYKNVLAVGACEGYSPSDTLACNATERRRHGPGGVSTSAEGFPYSRARARPRRNFSAPRCSGFFLRLPLFSPLASFIYRRSPVSRRSRLREPSARASKRGTKRITRDTVGNKDQVRRARAKRDRTGIARPVTLCGCPRNAVAPARMPDDNCFSRT